MIGYLVVTITGALRENAAAATPPKPASALESRAGAIATEVARAWGVSDLIIGLTVVAVGTSLPEMATSVVATIRGEREMAVGNVVGSCLFNLGVVLAVTALVSPQGIPVEAAAVRFDLPVMLATAFVLLPVAFIGTRISRWEGGLFLAYYAAYVLYLVWTAVEHGLLPILSTAMVAFVLPLTAIALIVLSVAEWRLRRARGSG